MINAIYLANQRQTAESLLMIIIYIYTHYVHAASSPRNDASPLSSCLCPQAHWPKISWDDSSSPEPPAQVSNWLHVSSVLVSLLPTMGCLCYKGAGFTLILSQHLETKLLEIISTTQGKQLWTTTGMASRGSSDGKDWICKEILHAPSTASFA